MKLRPLLALGSCWCALALGAAAWTHAARAPASDKLWQRATLSRHGTPCSAVRQASATPSGAPFARQNPGTFSLPAPPRLTCADAEPKAGLPPRGPRCAAARADPGLALHDGFCIDAAAQAGMAAPVRLLLGVPLELNGSDADALAGIPGVSRQAARSLVAHRLAHGPLLSRRELLAVPHVGSVTAKRLLAGTTGLVASAEPEANAWHPQPARATSGAVQRAWVVEVVRFLPQGVISRLWGWLTRRQWPRFFVEWSKATFVRAVGIDMNESAEPIESFASLQDLFVRTLRPGLRPIEGDVQALVSPVDARVGAHGTVEDGILFQIKGRPYTLSQLFDDGERARQFEGGTYITLYLSPRDYHRIHAPAAGHVVAARLVPGRLMPVFEESLQRCEALFARNERIITYLKAIDAGDVAVVAVGATLVGHMRVAYDDALRGNTGSGHARTVRYDKPTWFEKGEELGAFELGSTVVLVFQKNKVALSELAWGEFVRMGQRIGRSQNVPRGRDQGGGPQILRRDHFDD